MPSSTPSSSTAGAVNGVDPPSGGGFQAARLLVESVQALSADHGFRWASSVLDENARLHQRLESKDAEVAQLNEKMHKFELAKAATYDEMFDMNRREKNKCAEILKQVKSREAYIKEKDKLITEQQGMIESLKQQSEKSEKLYEKEKEAIQATNKEITKVYQQLKRNNAETDVLKAKAGENQERLSNTERRVKELETAKSALEENLQNASSRVHELESYGVTCYEDNYGVLMERIYSFWESARRAVSVYLMGDLPADSLQNHQAWRRLRFPSNMPHKVPLPQSNSDAAKQMRLSVFLAILTREINNQILHPTYLTPDDDWIREVLVDMAMRDDKKESFCRAVLLSIGPEMQIANLKERVETVVKNVTPYLHGLVSSQQYEDIQKRLEEIAQEAATVWSQFQRSKARYEPDFDPLEYNDDEWRPFRFDKTTTTDTGEENQAKGSGEIEADEALLIIYPRICRLENQEREPCNYVTALTKSQCEAAEQEQRSKEPPSPTRSKPPASGRRLRAASLSHNLVNGQESPFLGTTGPSGEQSGK